MGDAPKYNRSKHANCLGCGVANSNGSPNENSCLFHTPEKEESIFKKLESPNVEFVASSKDNPTQDECHMTCELATFLEMLVTPHPEPEPESEELDRSIKAYFETADFCRDRRDGPGATWVGTKQRRLFHGPQHECVHCDAANQMLSAYNRKYNRGYRTFDRFLSLHRPKFASPHAQFANVENLTMDISAETSTEFKRRLFEHFKPKETDLIHYQRGEMIETFELRSDFANSFRLDLSAHFPNLKTLTIIDRSTNKLEERKARNAGRSALVEPDERMDVLLPHFLLPSSLRVLRVKQNVLDPRVYSRFLSSIGDLTDLLIDVMPANCSAIEEPSLRQNDALNRKKIVPVEQVDASALPHLRTARFTNVEFVPRRPLCQLLETFHMPESLTRFELPVTSGDNPAIDCLSLKNLSENLRCVFPPNMQCIDISTPYTLAIATKEVPSGGRMVKVEEDFLNVWDQHKIVLSLVSAFRVCYFEDAILRSVHHVSYKYGRVVPFVVDADKRADNLKRNFHLLLSGSQFSLPPGFVDRVIAEIEASYRDLIRETSDQFDSWRATISQLVNDESKPRVVPEHDAAVDSMVLNRLKHRVLTSLIAVAPKHLEHDNRRTLEEKSLTAFRCPCSTCDLARRAGLLTTFPEEGLSLFKCVGTSEYPACQREWSSQYGDLHCDDDCGATEQTRMNPKLQLNPDSVRRLPFSVSNMSMTQYDRTFGEGSPKPKSKGGKSAKKPKSSKTQNRKSKSRQRRRLRR
jgi:hypothetical protein